MDVIHPGIPGATNRWFSNQGQARRAALQFATRLGPDHTIAHDPRPSRGLPHYHVVGPNGRRMSGHFFYGRRPPRKVLRGRPWREYENELFAMPLPRPAPGAPRRGPRRPPIRGGGRGSGRRDPILVALMRVGTLIATASGAPDRAAQPIAAAINGLQGVSGRASGPWNQPAQRALSWLLNAQANLRRGNRGAVVTNLNDARLQVAQAMMARRQQLGRPAREYESDGEAEREWILQRVDRVVGEAMAAPRWLRGIEGGRQGRPTHPIDPIIRQLTVANTALSRARSAARSRLARRGVVAGAQESLDDAQRALRGLSGAHVDQARSLIGAAYRSLMPSFRNLSAAQNSMRLAMDRLADAMRARHNERRFGNREAYW